MGTHVPPVARASHRQKFQDNLVIAEMAEPPGGRLLRLPGCGHGCRRPPDPSDAGQRYATPEWSAQRVRGHVLGVDVCLRLFDNPQRVCFTLLAGVAPGRCSVSAQNDAYRLGVLVTRIAAISSPSWKPGRRQGTQRTRSPYMALVSCSPSAEVAMAIALSGWRWSTCGDRPKHAWRCRSKELRRRDRAGKNQTRGPSRLRVLSLDRREAASAAGQDAELPIHSRSECLGRRPIP